MDHVDQAISNFNEGDLDGAISSCEAALRANLNDHHARVYLGQFLAFQENWDRIDKICEQIIRLAVGNKKLNSFAMVLKQLSDAERHRSEVWSSGKLPDVFVEPDEATKALLKAWAFEREGRGDAAIAALDAVPPQSIAGQCNEESFSLFEDLDPHTRHVFEFLVPNGSYFWLPYAATQEIEFTPLSRPMDQCWRQARVTLKTGQAVHGYMPVRYYGSAKDDDVAYRLGNMTRLDEWDNQMPRGVGRRIFVAGDDREYCALTVDHLVFN